MDECGFVRVRCEEIETNGASNIPVLNGGDYNQCVSRPSTQHMKRTVSVILHYAYE